MKNVLLLVLLTGCAVPAMPGGLAPSSREVREAQKHGSWMLPDAAKVKFLLYVSDASTHEVYVHDYSTGKKEGELAGFGYPTGQCVDAKGNVWIIDDYRDTSIVEFAHGGTAPLKKLSVNAGAPGCSVAPNGDLAVSVYEASGNGIDVFKKASGKPKKYSSSTCTAPWSPGYDLHGNLYVSDWENGVGNVVCELPARLHRFKNVKVTGIYGAFFDSSSVTWDGKYLALSSDNGPGDAIINQMAESRSGDLTEVGYTELKEKCQGCYVSLPVPFIVGEKNPPVNDQQGTSVVGAVTMYANLIYVWKYPGGGRPVRKIANPPARPYSEAVSIAP
ncbi:MAG TPA: hypothetical protein VFE16_12750 [Candidatus Cybelea sp.]|nr:hypothetical protein [Candidatus Cybelea sp.]